MGKQFSDMAPRLEEEFWKHVDKGDGTSCWNWTGARFPSGYGRLIFTENGATKSHLAHRLSHELNVGPIPEGLVVCHRCDNRACVRPEHLFAETQKANMADMVRKGRGIKPENSTFRLHPELVRGEAHHSAVLTEDKVKEIRKRYAETNVACGDLAREYGVTTTQIRRIATGKVWRHIPFDGPIVRRKSGVAAKAKAPSKQRGSRVLPPLTDTVRVKLEARFWSKVDKSGECWLWIASRSPRGYGSFSVLMEGRWRVRVAHRVSFELANGPLPKGLCVCHKCDNPSCVRPEHLFLGTQKANIEDMSQKKRGTLGDKSTARRFPEKLPRGEANYSAKLTTQAVKEIRELYQQDGTFSKLARRFG